MALRQEEMNRKTLHAAINDGINRYVREVLIPMRLIDPARYDSLGHKIDALRHQVCDSVTDQWACYQFDPDA